MKIQVFYKLKYLHTQRYFLSSELEGITTLICVALQVDLKRTVGASNPSVYLGKGSDCPSLNQSSWLI